MYLKKSISNGKAYLSFVQGYRKDGKVKQKTIQKLGYLEDLEKYYDDPVAYFRQQAKTLTREHAPEKTLSVCLSKRLEDHASSRKNLGYAIPKNLYLSLGIRDFFQKKQRSLHCAYNLNQIFSLLVFDRLLFPSSKREAFEKKNRFFESFRFSLEDVYRSLDLFAAYSADLQKHLHQAVCSQIGRTDSFGYYDVTNYYFEIPYEDDDQLGPDGELLKRGMRKKGPSKERRKDPIVQMGLLMDSNGLPMAFHTFPGNQSEKTSLRPTIGRAKRDFGLERIIVVADRGLNTSDNAALLSGINDDFSSPKDGYVYGQSILGADKEFRQWVLRQEDYLRETVHDPDGQEVSFRHKSRLYAKKVSLKAENGKRSLPLTIYQKQMVYYSQAYARRQKKERQKAISKALDLISHPGKYTRSTSLGAAGYVTNLHFSKETGEITDGHLLSLNMEKIRQEEAFDGYYSIVTSEKDLTDQELHKIYKGLWEIEESFRILKSDFRTRPVYVRTQAHIEAHFLVCFTALLLLRVLEDRLGRKYSVREIRNALVNYSCSYLEQNYYLFDYRDDVLKEMETIFGMDFGKKILSLAEIKKFLQMEKKEDFTTETCK